MLLAVSVLVVSAYHRWLLWDRKIPPELAVGEVPGTIYGLSDKGWIDQQSSDMCIFSDMHLLLILLQDGHSSHYCPQSAAQESHYIVTPP